MSTKAFNKIAAGLHEAVGYAKATNKIAARIEELEAEVDNLRKLAHRLQDEIVVLRTNLEKRQGPPT